MSVIGADQRQVPYLKVFDHRLVLPDLLSSLARRIDVPYGVSFSHYNSGCCVSRGR